MKVDKLIYDHRIADKVHDGGINFLKQHITTTYIPYMEKVSRCELLVKSCWYRTDPGTGIKRLVVNSPNLYVMYVMELIRLYTDIQLDYEGTGIVQNYDALKTSGILKKIVSLIPKSEIEEFQQILGMTKSDIMTNEYQVGAYVRNRLNDITTIVGNLIIPVLKDAGFTKEGLATLLSSPELASIISSIQGNN